MTDGQGEHSQRGRSRGLSKESSLGWRWAGGGCGEWNEQKGQGGAAETGMG